MSLDPEKICEMCGENIHGYGHRAACPNGSDDYRIGMWRSDEEGWVSIEAVSATDEAGRATEYELTDKHGGSHYLAVERMGDGWIS